jgi:hypothetical protein
LLVLYALVAGLFINAGLDVGTLLRASFQTIVVLSLMVRWLFVPDRPLQVPVPSRGIGPAKRFDD